MKIADHTVVSLVYELSIANPEEDFELVEVVSPEEPFFFLYGHSGLPEDFEKSLEGKTAEDTFDFDLDPQKGFGVYSENDISDFELDFFKVDEGKVPEGLLELGNFVPFTNEAGHQVIGKVIEVTSDSVTVDFNHPLAGKKLHFVGKVLGVRAASKDEIDHGHVHGEGGVHH